MQSIVNGGEGLRKLYHVACKREESRVYGCLPNTEYTGLVDTDEVDIHDKQTIQFIKNNSDKLAKEWDKKARANEYDSGYDLISDLYLEMAKKEDYSPTYTDEEGRIIPIEGYIFKTLTNLCKRKKESMVSYNIKHTSLYVSSESGDEADLSLLDYTADESVAKDFENLLDNASFTGQQIEAVECITRSRSMYGSDLVNINYVIAKGQSEGVSDAAIRAAITSLCGIDHMSKSKMNTLLKNTAVKESMLILAKDPQKSVELLQPLVRGRKTVDSLIKKARA